MSERLREVAATVEAVGARTPSSFDEETIAEYEAEYGEVPSIEEICDDIATTLRETALLVEVHERASGQMDVVYRAVCRDCGWERECRPDETGVGAKVCAERARGGHLGGQRKHFSLDPCENVEVIREVDEDE